MKPSTSVRQPGGLHRHRKPGGCQALRFARNGHGATVDLLQQIGNVVRDDIDDMKREGVGGRKACGGTHGVCGPVGIAAVKRGEAANIGGRIVDDLARLGVRRFAGFTERLLF